MPAILDQRGGNRPGYAGMDTPPRNPGYGLAGLWSSLGLYGHLVNRVLWQGARLIANRVDHQRGA